MFFFICIKHLHFDYFLFYFLPILKSYRPRSNAGLLSSSPIIKKEKYFFFVCL